MLSCDVMLRTTQPYAGLIQLSGTLLALQEWAPLLQKRKGLPVFQSHGMQDEILPYVGAEALRDTLTHAGLSVEWHSFHGGHEIPRTVLPPRMAGSRPAFHGFERPVALCVSEAAEPIPV